MEVDPKTSFSWQWNPTKRHLQPGDSLFEDGDIFCNLLLKQIPLEDKDEIVNKISEFPCGMAGCKESFNNLLSYECHYNSFHRNICATCHRVFPSSYLLGIHIQEWHDVMFEIMCGKKPMYTCLLEACGQQLKTCQDRKEHMIKMHKYPANFRFDKQKNQRNCAVGADNMSTNQSGSIKLKEKKCQRKFIYKIPKDICFGKGSIRTFQSQQSHQKHWHQQHRTETDNINMGIEQVKMDDLIEVLEESS